MEDKEKTYAGDIIQLEGVILGSMELNAKELSVLLVELLKQKEVKEYLDLQKDIKRKGLSSMFS